MKEKILALLRTSSDYISGQAICEKLGVVSAASIFSFVTISGSPTRR